MMFVDNFYLLVWFVFAGIYTILCKNIPQKLARWTLSSIKYNFCISKRNLKKKKLKLPLFLCTEIHKLIGLNTNRDRMTFGIAKTTYRLAKYSDLLFIFLMGANFHAQSLPHTRLSKAVKPKGWAHHLKTTLKASKNSQVILGSPTGPQNMPPLRRIIFPKQDSNLGPLGLNPNILATQPKSAL